MDVVDQWEQDKQVLTSEIFWFSLWVLFCLVC